MQATPLAGPVIVGAGLAGLSAALAMAPAPCTVLTAGRLAPESTSTTSTHVAQGGLAAVTGDDDSIELHVSDTLAAGAGLCDPAAVRAIVGQGPSIVETLLAQGVAFDRDADGSLTRGLEGAHSRRRVLHAGGDRSGASILAAVTARVRATPSITVTEGVRVLRVLTDGARVVGLLVESGQRRHVLACSQVVLATGGMGGLYTTTTNPVTSRALGVALAARAGAVIRDVEMIQFHPTALDVPLSPRPLISEAVRGEGATVVDQHGTAFVDPLAARDVVSRAEWEVLHRRGRVFLDARGVGDFDRHFPQIEQILHTAGLDPRHDLIPVRPAAHYAMGGILADLAGGTTVPGLRAIGECASTGLHGANRLASNSLLEAAVCGRWAGEALAGTTAAPPDIDAAVAAASSCDLVSSTAPIPVSTMMEAFAGVMRDADGLALLRDYLQPHLDHDDALVGWMLAHAALARTESRGGHARRDFPTTSTLVEHTLTSAPVALAAH